MADVLLAPPSDAPLLPASSFVASPWRQILPPKSGSRRAPRDASRLNSGRRATTVNPRFFAPSSHKIGVSPFADWSRLHCMLRHNTIASVMSASIAERTIGERLAHDDVEGDCFTRGNVNWKSPSLVAGFRGSATRTARRTVSRPCWRPCRPTPRSRQ